MANSKQTIKPLILIVLDGWGLALSSEGNAITQAVTPNLDFYFGSYPHTNLAAHGEAVGLPHGYMGNSEVGHLTLGSGRVIEQDLTRINRSIKDKTFFQNSTLLATIKHVQDNNSKLHLMGLLSRGGVHGETRHLYALLELAKQKGLKKVYIHAFTDGRDMAPQSAGDLIGDLERKTKEIGVGEIASITGRYYAMDRAHNWKRSADVYNTMVYGQGEKASSPLEAIDRAYQNRLNDQQIPPTVIVRQGKPIATIENSDAIIFFNFRSDRARQITKPFVLKDFPFFDRGKRTPNIFFVGMTNFGNDLPMLIAYPDVNIKNSLPEILGKRQGMKQLYLAEEEKFSHVAFFFHGGSSILQENEERLMLDSPNIDNYADLPEMALPIVAQTVQEKLKTKKYNFILMNVANPDMLAHTGDIAATVKAIEIIDKYLKQVIDVCLQENGTVIITADHGNAEEMIDLETGQIDTKHSSNPVPFTIVGEEDFIKEYRARNLLKLRDGELADVVPTILKIMDIPKPKEMTGHSLI